MCVCAMICHTYHYVITTSTTYNFIIYKIVFCRDSDWNREKGSDMHPPPNADGRSPKSLSRGFLPELLQVEFFIIAFHEEGQSQLNEELLNSDCALRQVAERLRW